jgi:hypothetical protein
MRHFNLAAQAVLLSLLVGCAGITPGNDPVVVNAERVTAAAAETFDGLFKTEAENHAVIKARAPQVASGVNRLRKLAPAALDSARAVTKAYKNNRSAENKANVGTAIAVLQSLLDQARVYLTEVQ